MQQDFLEKGLNKNITQRWSASEMLNHPWLSETPLPMKIEEMNHEKL